MNKKEIVKEIVDYINQRFNSDEHGESYWIMPNKQRITVDVGYAYEWWNDCMLVELAEKYEL